MRFETRPDGRAREVIGVRQDVVDLFQRRRRAITAKTPLAGGSVAAFDELADGGVALRTHAAPVRIGLRRAAAGPSAGSLQASVGRTHLPGVHVAGGHGMWGLTLGPVTGKLLAQQIMTGTTVPALAPLDPCRRRVPGRTVRNQGGRAGAAAPVRPRALHPTSAPASSERDTH